MPVGGDYKDCGPNTYLPKVRLSHQRFNGVIIWINGLHTV